MFVDEGSPSPELYLAAGRLAERLGWQNTTVVTVGDLVEMGPEGPPLIILAEHVVSDDVARSIAALVGAGRPCRLVTKGEVPDSAVRWLPGGSLVGCGQAETVEDQALPLAQGGQGARILEIQGALGRLSLSRDPKMRAAVAMQILTPAPALEQLSNDPEWWVQNEALANPQTPVSVLESPEVHAVRNRRLR
jgi:hypothetical protein